MLTEQTDQQPRVDSLAVQLEIPASGDLLTLARLTAATLAARSAFTVEEVEDLRLAVDELRLPLVRACSEGRLRLEFEASDAAVRIECTLLAHPEWREDEGRPDSIHPEDALSVCILDALVDEHGPIDPGRPVAGHWLRKSREQLTS